MGVDGPSQEVRQRNNDPHTGSGPVADFNLTGPREPLGSSDPDAPQAVQLEQETDDEDGPCEDYDPEDAARRAARAA
eukprot:16341638-Heterocapsa_arctica.AAC.1